MATDPTVGLELIYGHDGKLTIQQCEEIAQQLAVDDQGCKFMLCGPDGSLEAEWLDPSLGFFTLKGQPGFMTTKQFAFVNVWCTGVFPVPKGKTDASR